MKSVWSNVYEVHFFRVHHEFRDSPRRRFNARTRRFRLSHFDCAIHPRLLENLEDVYRRDMRARARLLEYMGVRVHDLGVRHFYREWEKVKTPNKN